MRTPNFLKTAAAMTLCLSCLACNAQEKPIYNVPSPDVASLGTYGTVPVCLFTGTPDISILLYDLSVGSYTFPITATYHTGTVKPHAQPGITGLGWSLRTDGYISRTVHGVYDEKQCRQYIHGYYGHAKECVTVMDYDATDRSRSMPYVSRLTKIRNGVSKVEYQALSADEYGNPTEIIENGKHSTLVWVYKGQRLGARLENYSLASRGKPKILIKERGYTNVDTTVIEDPAFPDIDESYDFGYKQYPGSLIHLYAYDGCLRLESHTDPSLQTTRYAHDALGRLQRVYFNEKRNGDSRKAILKRYTYDYYNDDATQKLPLNPDAMSQDVSNEHTEVSVADSYRRVSPTKGYADTLKLAHWNSGTTPDSLRGCLITLTDTQTIRFRCVDFQYTRGLDSGMPDGKLPLEVRLYDDTSSPDSLKASFRWYVVGKENICADTTAVDTSGLVLSPGTYLLVYGGYKEDVGRFPYTQTSTVIQGEQSAITV